MDDKSIPATYSVLFRSHKFADVQICIVEDPTVVTSLERGQGSNALEPSLETEEAKKVLDVFPGHQLILWHGSEFFRAKVSM